MLANLKEIFILYGGWKAFRSSSYVIISMFLSFLLWRDAVSGAWSRTIADYLPPVLGFSFAALAILTAIGDDQFRRKMSKIDVITKGESDLTTITANFCWFIVVQIFAVLLAIFFSAKPVPYFCNLTIYVGECQFAFKTTNMLFGLLGNFLLVYAILLIVAAISQMMNVFRLYLRSLPTDENSN
ncbi:hypothetical protein E3U23_08455 [Erythrobacter litoralis]|uniref:hypothetical protein n=1 Tax=Erythrobacter litoralis TaxID=39960 RepID=UPI0024349E21|nr:hypothetical protein [Erythrobacter litoralis]MDG6079223.1 hypothetical protein [Erythrobacter litoralis]